MRLIRYAAFAALVSVLGYTFSRADGAQGDASTATKYTNSLGMQMIRVPPGNFQMGSSRGDYDERPIHEVTISRQFYFSETEMTVRAFQQFRPDYQDMGPFTPYVTGISWEDAVAFCNWLSKKKGVLTACPQKRNGSTQHERARPATSRQVPFHLMPASQMRSVSKTWNPRPLNGRWIGTLNIPRMTKSIRSDLPEGSRVLSEAAVLWGRTTRDRAASSHTIAAIRTARALHPASVAATRLAFA